jgi:maltooligosyltrehalose trehalohydrolase
MRVDFDEDQRWIVMHRGSLAIACNLNVDDVVVPVTGEVVLAWGDPSVDGERTRLAGHSFAITRGVNR